MHAQDAVKSATRYKILDRMHSIGRFVIAERENQSEQVTRQLDIKGVPGDEVYEGFRQLIEEGEIREFFNREPLGPGGTTNETVYENQITYLLDE